MRRPTIPSPTDPRRSAPHSGVPRLLYVVNNASFFDSHRLPVAIAAREAGYDVHIAAPACDALTALSRTGLAVHEIRLNRGGLRPDQELVTLLSMFRLYARLRPDIVHHVTIKPMLYGGVVARVLRIPAVVHAVSGLGWVFGAREPMTSLVRRVAMALYRVAFAHPNSRVIVQNPDDQAELVGHGLLAREQSELIRGSGVDLEVYRPMPGTQEALVLFASRMLWDKGVGEFVDAARQLQAKGVVARFAMAGEPDPANPGAVPLDQLRAWHDEGVVEWLGHRNDMPQLIARSRIFCLPSYYREGIPKVLLEAAACGRPIVTTDWPGCREAVDDGRTGLLVEPRDVDSLAHALEKLLADPDRSDQMGTAGRRKAEEEFGLQQVVKATLHVYADLLARANGGA